MNEEKLSAQTIHSKSLQKITILLSFLALTMLTACFALRVDKDLLDRRDLETPRPLVEQIPITVGVHYDEKLRSHYLFDEFGHFGVEVEYRLGPPSITLFEPIFASMFETVLRVEDPSATAAAGRKIGSVLSLTIDKFIPPSQDTGQMPVPPQVRYALTLYSPPGVVKTTVIAAGAHDKGNKSYSHRDLVARAMRDAAADLIVSFLADPVVSSWLGRATPRKQASGK